MPALAAIARIAALLALLMAVPAAAQQAPAAGEIPEATELPSLAPDETAPNTAAAASPADAAWERAATRAETALEEDQASTAALESLRRELVDWRTTFEEAGGINESRLQTLRAQIAALGPPPAEGETEADDVAVRRAELNRELARLEAPRRAAEEAYSRADALIRQIDARVRERQADELLKLGPSPLNPSHWGDALRSVGSYLTLVAGETRANVTSATQMAAARERLPIILLLAALAAVCLFRGPRWTRSAGERIGAMLSPLAQRLVRFIMSLLSLVLVILGFLALTGALREAHLFGYRGETLVQTLPLLGILLFGAFWLADQIFGSAEAGGEVLALPPERRAEGRFFAGLLGAMLWLVATIRTVAPAEGWDDATLAVLQFPPLVLAGLSLSRLGQIIARRIEHDPDTPQASQFRRQLARVVGRIAQILGFAGPVLAAVGYLAAAAFLTFPLAISLALLAVLVILQTFLSQGYALLTRQSEEESTEALMPVLIGLMLGAASIPLFALIWGARVADLTELWTRFRSGFRLGETVISPGMLLTFLVVFAIGYAATRLLQGTLRAAVLPKTRLDAGGRNAIVAGVGYLGIILAALAAITATGLDLSALALVFGALSVGIGFGLQNIVQNFISGIIMLIERPVAEGDWIEVGGKMGIVKDISVRSTRIQTFDRTSVIVPNGEFISGIVTNWTRGNLTGRIIVSVGVAYGTDTRKVEAILREVAEAHPLVTLNPPPLVVFAAFGADALEFEIRAILRDVNFSLSAKSDIHHEIARRFAEAGIEIPFGQRDIWLRNPETLRGIGPASAGQVAAGQGPSGPQEPPKEDTA